jgi:hypothetical protein
MLESLFQFRLLSQRVFSSQRVVLLASAKSGIQEVVLACAEHLLMMAGWKVLNLGANTSIELLNAAVITSQPKLTCVCKDYLEDAKYRELILTASECKTQLLFSNFDSSIRIPEISNNGGIAPRFFSSLNEMLTLIFQFR